MSPPGNLPDPVIKPMSFRSLALAVLYHQHHPGEPVPYIRALEFFFFKLKLESAAYIQRILNDTSFYKAVSDSFLLLGSRKVL